MFRNRLTIALAVLAAAAVLECVVALWAVGVADRQVKRGRVASDIHVGFIQLYASKQRLRTWVSQAQLNAGADPAVRDQLLAQMRRTLEQLRVIGVQTKAMKDDAMAVGESFASFPGMGLGWYAARRDITTGWQGFVNAYNGKYRQLLESLSRALKEVGACEAEYFGQRDWYERFGFIYYEFIQDRYDPARILD